MKTAAIYARVSSDRQKEEQTIASQTAALLEYAEAQGLRRPFGMDLSRRRLQRIGSGAAFSGAAAGSGF